MSKSIEYFNLDLLSNNLRFARDNLKRIKHSVKRKEEYIEELKVDKEKLEHVQSLYDQFLKEFENCKKSYEETHQEDASELSLTSSDTEDDELQQRARRSLRRKLLPGRRLLPRIDESIPFPYLPYPGPIGHARKWRD